MYGKNYKRNVKMCLFVNVLERFRMTMNNYERL
jgi:hypothetical protein